MELMMPLVFTLVFLGWWYYSAGDWYLDPGGQSLYE